MLQRDILNSYIGHSIKDICPNRYDNVADNHCAHFVCHALQLRFGYTCAMATGAADGANLRVQELFGQCRGRREVLECPTAGEGLLFVSARSSFRGAPHEIANVPRKHVGILLDGRVWHYSNSKKQVVVQSASEFLSHYPKQVNALWVGGLPGECRPTSLGTCT